ncbi:betaine--homocysteine S-methyltransferase 1-like isoform X2 [Dysidea avara]|uniref:betaine--homocysteine S-methyltransferase 1-like isoform X2 n=1 Tax=Dysidea avara TaxID=196820 RepID=UPI0033283996
MAELPIGKRAKKSVRSLEERLNAGESVIVAEGYLLSLSRRGYVSHGSFIPDVVLEHPEMVRLLHYEFAHCGSDVMEAFQYYTLRSHLRKIGREDDLEKCNRLALKMAKEVADEKGLLFAGGLCNSSIYVPGDEKSHKEVRAIFEEQVKWCVEEGVDYMIGETFRYFGEAMIALDVIKAHGKPAVITFCFHRKDDNGQFTLLDEVNIGDACKQIADAGALVVGLNCARGPGMMIEVIEEIRKKCPNVHLAALPVAYRTTEEEPTFYNITDKGLNQPAYPDGLDPLLVSISEIKDFTKKAYDLGVRYFGICCGNSGHYTRTMAETLGRSPPASKYATDVTSSSSVGQEMKGRTKMQDGRIL